MKSGVVFVLFALFGGIVSLFLFSQKSVPTLLSIKQSPQITSSFSLEHAPTMSLTGTILSWSGAIFWESRIATQSAPLEVRVPIEQGESIETKDTGNIVIAFDPIASFSAHPTSHVNIIQTIPTSMVFEQTSGTVTYTASDLQKLSVRALHALIQQTSGTIKVSMNADTTIVTITLISGTAIIAFNDIDTVSTEVPLSSGDIYVFHDATRIGKLTKQLF